MPREWQPNGSNAEYWRSDNPLIGGWWRFGDDLPKNNYQNEAEQGAGSYLSGLMRDSGPAKHHLLPYYRNASEPQDYLVPVEGIAPWATGGSGCKISWDNSTEQMDFVYADPGAVIQNNATTTDHGTLGNGVNMYSGMTVIGWAQVPDTGGSFTGGRTLIGRADQDTSLGTHLLWRVVFAQQAADDYILAFTYLSQTNFLFNGVSTSATRVLQSCQIDSADFPFFPTNREEPFWFAVQVSREAVEENRSYTGNGSGIARIYVGTETSGLIAKVERFFRGTDIDLTFISPDTGGVPLSMFNESRGLRAASYSSTNRYPPSGTILDEVVVVNDGFMSDDRILHYALSGMTKVDTSDPEHPDFEVEFPGNSGLVAYWTFDEDDGHNTAPPTLNDPRLEFSLSGLGTSLSFQDGIKDGRCIQVDASNAMVNTTDGELMLARNDYPAIPAESGLPLIFPAVTL